MVASDRISAFDYVLPTEIPDKGRILTQLSLWWFDQLADDVENHVVSTDVPAEFAGRAILCRRLDMVPVECVARGYLAGSGLTEYTASGSVCGVPLPAGLVDGSQLPEPIFTPATKAAIGDHDENVSYDVVAATVGTADGSRAAQADPRRLRPRAADRRRAGRHRGGHEAGVRLGRRRQPGARRRGAHPRLVALLAGRAAGARAGTQPSYDKQFVRDWLTSPASGWDRASGKPPPPLPDEVVAKTRSRYVEAYERLTGIRWD